MGLAILSNLDWEGLMEPLIYWRWEIKIWPVKKDALFELWLGAELINKFDTLGIKLKHSQHNLTAQAFQLLLSHFLLV